MEERAADSTPERLDLYVLRQLPGISRATGSKLIKLGKVKVNKKLQTKAGFKIRSNDIIDIDYNDTVEDKVPEISLPIIYEDKDCVIVNKPAGILSHSKGRFNPEATVATWLKPKLKGLQGERAGIVHRLDRATSGVMICAKNPESLKWLQKQLSQRRTKKVYLAVIKGKLENKQAIVDMPIERNPKLPQTFRVGVNGKSAITEYTVLKEGPEYSLVELRPTTGRTHQLRVHMKQLGHPVVGDTLYGDSKTRDRMYLHANSLEITLPNKERKVFVAEVPKEFRKII